MHGCSVDQLFKPIDEYDWKAAGPPAKGAPTFLAPLAARYRGLQLALGTERTLPFVRQAGLVPAVQYILSLWTQQCGLLSIYCLPLVPQE